jgi:hypothetical protein
MNSKTLQNFMKIYLLQVLLTELPFAVIHAHTRVGRALVAMDTEKVLLYFPLQFPTCGKIRKEIPEYSTPIFLTHVE